MLLDIDHPSRLAECRRLAVQVARAEDLPEDPSARAAVVASELATNLLKYAIKGVLQVLPLSPRGNPGVEIVAIDSGPGMADVEHYMRDGESTGSTSGTGLGAVRRLSDEFDIYSQPGKGTVVMAQIRAQPGAAPRRLDVGVTQRPVAREDVSGDSWGVREDPQGPLFLVSDGLGHGVFAAEASAVAVAAFLKAPDQAPAEMVQTIHAALRGTRGAAIAVARLDSAQGRVVFAGLGNIAGFVITSDRSQGMISHNGTAGHEARHIREFVYSWTPRSILVMHSDGLTSNWNLGAYPGIMDRQSAIISGILYRDGARDRDDACVIAAKLR